MASADSNVFSITIASGPAWIAGKSNLQWYQTITNTIDAVKPSPLPPSGGGGGFETLTVWSGAAPNQVGKYVDVWGGGHSAYSGNEHYGLLYGQDTPAISRLNNPTPNGQITTGGTVSVYADGRPVACHSGDHIGCDNAGNFWTVSLGRTISQGISFPHVWRWVRATDTWTQTGALNASSPVFQFSSRNAVYALAHDPVTNKFYWIGQMGSTAVVDASLSSGAASDFYTGEVSELDVVDERTATIFTAPSGVRALILFRSIANRIYLMNLDNPAGGWTAKTPTGSPSLHQGAGIQWHNASGCALVWGHTTSRQQVWKLVPPSSTPSTYAQLTSGTWAWSALNPTSGAIVPSLPRGARYGDSSGTYKRAGIILNISTTQDLFYVINATDERPYEMLIPKTGVP